MRVTETMNIGGQQVVMRISETEEEVVCSVTTGPEEEEEIQFLTEEEEEIQFLAEEEEEIQFWQRRKRCSSFGRGGISTFDAYQPFYY